MYVSRTCIGSAPAVTSKDNITTPRRNERVDAKGLVSAQVYVKQ